MSKLLEDVVGELTRLPGIGRRTALRLALHILKMEREDVGEMTMAMDRFRSEIKYCRSCNNLSDGEFCNICMDNSREREKVCVVESVSDVLTIENSRQYRGLYHVLGGVISPMQGIGPSNLKIDLLLEHISKGEVRELILAISTTVEGETTQYYITKRVEEVSSLKISTIARGIGFGDEIEYADELTIGHAFHNRIDIKQE